MKKTRKTLRQTVGRNFLWRPVRALLRSRGIFLPKNNIALQYSVSSIAYPSRFEREREAEKTKSRIETRRCKRPLHEINVQPDTCSSSSFLFFLFSFFPLFFSSFHSDATFIVSVRTNFNDEILSISRNCGADV